MATILPVQYKIERNVPVTRAGRRGFDESIPEYQVMLKLKVGDSFEFPRDRVNFVHNCRVHLRKQESPLAFTFTTPGTFRSNPKMLVGRCWRVKDGSFKSKGPRKVRAKGANIDLREVKNM